ncbi:MAG: response regulator [Treponema sp.]|jgi:chemotaxis protein histidine kinase CheA/CheY-like chemotaxis protein|nr:response regulator [Treponema sp.]
MAINKEKYISKFIDEGLENIAEVESLLFEVKDGGSLEDDLVTLLRALHTLKGSARMLEFTRIEALAHALESVFIAVKEQRITFSDNALRLSLAALDVLKAGLGVVQKSKHDTIATTAFEQELAALASNEDFIIPTIEPGDDTEAPAQEEARITETVRGSESSEVRHEAKREKIEDAKSESIRIPLEKINDIIRNMAALQSLEISAKTIALDMENLREACMQCAKGFITEEQMNEPLVQEFRTLEHFIGKLASKVKNYAVDVGNHTKGAYNSVISLRMLPLSTILDAYPRYVFEMAAELGKKARLYIEGDEQEIDKNIIETLSDIFIHIIRNGIDHGIESPEARREAGKNETGQISIRCIRESGNMKIMISDDGRGIDIEGIRKKIVALEFIEYEAAAQLAREEVMNYIFRSGFTTASTLTSVSGRGVGMDVVHESIERIKGSILVDSVDGGGTTFTIVAPLSIASLIGFPIICGNLQFIIPANFVDTILLINREDIITIVDHPGLKFNNHIVKLYYLNQILRIQSAEQPEKGAPIFVVMVQAYDETIALAIDSISTMRQVILKSMPECMERMSIFSGVVLSEEYDMVPALHVPTLIKMAKRTKSIDMKRRHIEYEKTQKTILIVDDSLPTREIERDILQAEGYTVDTAGDGAEALVAAKNMHYDLICTDINMPQMDGFMLTENIRKNQELAELPIIIISSKSSEEDQKRAVMLGANRYILKNSFNNHNLITAVRDLIGAAHE